MDDDLFSYSAVTAFTPPGRALIDPPPVRHDHPETSQQAADAIAPITGQLRKDVYSLAVVRGRGGIIDADLFAHWPNRSENSLRPRRIELVQAGRLVDSGRRRKNGRGRDCVVWTLPEFKEEKK